MTQRGIVAISGPDNVGKSTQLRILARRAAPDALLLGPLHEFDPRWSRIPADGLASWWFGGATPVGFVDVLTTSYLTRHRAASAGRLCLVDRGIPMLKATVAATMGVREHLDDDAAADRAAELLARYAEALTVAECRETGVLLLHDADPEIGAAMSVAREASVDPTYAAYQRCLTRQIHRLAAAHRFERTIVVGSQRVMEVQDQVRKAVGGHDPRIPAAGLGAVHVVAFGGMSESGKSTAAEWLRTQHGYARLKIGYLLELAGSRHGIDDVYALDEITLAEMLVDSLDRYCAGHHYIKTVSIESLHRYEMSAALPVLLGDQLTIVFVDASLDTRLRRATAGALDVAERDEVKTARGADRIRDFADLVVPNDGPLLALGRRMDRLVCDRSWPMVYPSIRPVEALALPANLSSFVVSVLDRLTAGAPRLSLVAVTGSGGRGKYQEGWSDLDLLLIGDTELHTAIRDVVADYGASLRGVKLGLTLITEAECRAGTITPRILHTLRMIGTGDLGVQWCRPDLRLPCPPQESDAVASLDDGAVAAVELRRQMVRSIAEARTVFKLCALLAKVVLRLEATGPLDDEDALRGFVAEQLPDLVPTIVTQARHQEKAARQLAEALLDTWVRTLPANERARREPV